MLPISDQPDHMGIFFCSSNINDSRKIVINHPDGEIARDIGGRTTVMEFIKKPLSTCTITAKVFDKNTNELIYCRNIFIDSDYLSNKLSKNGLIERL